MLNLLQDYARHYLIWIEYGLQSAHDRSHFYAAGNRVLKSEDFGDDLHLLHAADGEQLRACGEELAAGLVPLEDDAIDRAADLTAIERGLVPPP